MELLADYAGRYWYLGNAIVGFAVVQLAATLMASGTNWMLRSLLTRWSFAVGLAVFLVGAGAVYVLALAFCSQQELTLLAGLRTASSQATRVQAVVDSVQSLQVWRIAVVAVAYALGAGVIALQPILPGPPEH